VGGLSKSKRIMTVRPAPLIHCKGEDSKVRLKHPNASVHNQWKEIQALQSHSAKCLACLEFMV
jgi:hypothetical protein